MALDINALRNKVKQTESRSFSNSSATSSVFSFSNLNVGDKIKIRFIEDGEPNDFFWRERCTRGLRFNSIRQSDGTILKNPVWVTVPAFNLKKGDTNSSNLPESYLYSSESDVINNKIKGFWDGTDEGKALYNKFGRRQSYIFQGFVRNEGYDTKLYRFIINKDLFAKIFSFVSDDEIDSVPCEVETGREFILNVTGKTVSMNGNTSEVKDYSTSKWSGKESPLTTEEKNFLSENPPFILKDFITKKPTDEQEKVMLELYEASYNDEPYDINRWLKVFRPDNLQIDDRGMVVDTNSKQSSIPSKIEAKTETKSQESIDLNNLSPEMKAQMMAILGGDKVEVKEEKKVSAPTLIKENTETVSGTSPEDVVNNLMAKFKIN